MTKTRCAEATGEVDALADRETEGGAGVVGLGSTPEPTTWVALVHSGEYSTVEVAELFGVGRSTVYRAIQRQREVAKAELVDESAQR